MKRFMRVSAAFLFVAMAWSGGLTAQGAQSYNPVVDVGRLMATRGTPSLRFYDQNARVMVSDVTIGFRPEGEHNTTVELMKAGESAPVATLEFFPGYQGSDSVFGDVRPKGPGMIQIPGAGLYALNFNIAGKLATTFPFAVVEEGSDDPFKPDKKYHYRGPWEQLIYLRESSSHRDRPIQVSFWTSGLEVAEDGKGELFVKLLKDGQLVARNKRAKRINKRSKLWAMHSETLHEPVDNPNAPGFTFEKLKAGNGNYEVVIEVDGKVVRRFPFEVDGGGITVSERSKLGYEPAEQHLLPRTIDMEKRGQSNYEAVEVFWLEVSKD